MRDLKPIEQFSYDKTLRNINLSKCTITEQRKIIDSIDALITEILKNEK